MIDHTSWDEHEDVADGFLTADADVAALADRLTAIARLHRPYACPCGQPHSPFCRVCSLAWPCATTRLAHGETVSPATQPTPEGTTQP